MHESAANKLLKLIEEPPEKTLIFLVSEKPENIILTIRSRTQMVKLDPLTDAQIANFLKQKHQLQDGEADSVARLVNGDLGRAVNIVAKGSQNQWFPLFRDWMRISYTGDMMKLLPWVDQINTFGREEQKNFLSYALEVIRQCLSGNYTEGELQRFSADELKFAKNFSPFINHSNAIEFMEVFQEAFRDVRGNLNGKLIFFDLTVNIHKLIRRSNRA
jgi:DNA polymerase-3 subunit delta'